MDNAIQRLRNLQTLTTQDKEEHHWHGKMGWVEVVTHSFGDLCDIEVGKGETIVDRDDSIKNMQFLRALGSEIVCEKEELTDENRFSVYYIFDGSVFLNRWYRPTVSNQEKECPQAVDWSNRLLDRLGLPREPEILETLFTDLLNLPKDFAAFYDPALAGKPSTEIKAAPVNPECESLKKQVTELSKILLNENLNQEKEYRRHGKEITSNKEEGWAIGFMRIESLRDGTLNLIELLARSIHDQDTEESEKLRVWINENLDELKKLI